MFKKVLVPLDGSELSERALPYARRLAGSLGRLSLVRATDDRGPSDQLPAYLDSVAERLQHDGVAAEWHIYHGSAAGAISREASLQRADTIVMSTHGRSGVQRLVFGSVAEQVLHEAEVPVLLVPARTHTSWRAGMAQQVVVPLDGSPLAEAALEPAVAMAGRLRASLLLLGVVEPLDLTSIGYQAFVPRELGATEDDVVAYLASVATRLHARGLDVATRTEIGHPAAAIAQLGAHEETAAVAIATHGRSGLAQLLMGSVTTDLVRHASSPLLVVRPFATERVVEHTVAAQRQSVPMLAGGTA